MEFNYKVQATKQQSAGVTGFLFNPESIKIIVGDKATLPDNTAVVNIQTVLRQNIEGGYTEQARMQQLPVSVLAAIDGFDVNAMAPTINATQLNAILAQFNLVTV